MNEVVRDPVHIPGDADRVNESHADKEPPWGKREDEKQREDVRAVKYSRGNRQRIPFRVGK